MAKVRLWISGWGQEPPGWGVRGADGSWLMVRRLWVGFYDAM